MFKNFIISLVTLLCILNGKVSAESNMGLPLIRNFNPEDYGGGIQNWQIGQDQQGLVYVANNFGLLQFDGNQWRIYGVSRATKMRSLAVSNDGIIYAGVQGDFGYFQADSSGFLKYYSLKSKIPEKHQDIGETWRTYIIGDKVYFCTFSKIYVYENGEVDVIDSKYGLDVSFSTGKEIYVLIPGKGLYYIKDRAFNLPEGMDFFSGMVVSAIVPMGANKLLITTVKHGIYIYNEGQIEEFDINLNKKLRESFVNRAKLLKNGLLAIGTQHEGLYLVNLGGEIVLHLDKENGLMSRTILSLHEDLNSNIWVGQNNGISFLEIQSPFRIINENLGLPGTGYSALQVNSELYLGTNNGVYIKSEHPKIIEGSEGQVYKIQNIGDQIVINHNDGGFLIENGHAVQFSEGSGSWTVLKYNDYFLQGTYEGIQVYHNNLKNPIGQIDNFSESSRILTLKDNDVWVSHGYKGLYQMKFDNTSILEPEIAFYNSENKLPSNLNNTATLIEGELKVITEGDLLEYDPDAGIFRQDSTLGKHFRGSQLITMQNDMFGNIYYITNNSMGFLEKKSDNDYIRHQEVFNRIRKLINDDLPNINIISPNEILFGAKEGFVLFDRNRFGKSGNEKFNTLIRNVTQSGDSSIVLQSGNSHLNPVQPNKKSIPRIDYKNGNITFEFSSTTYSATTAPEFQFRLIGFNKNWSMWTSVNYKEYTNLKEGFYTFQVKSKNANDQESEIEEFSFVVLSPWYRSPLAYILYVVFGVTALFGLVISLDRKYESEKKKLEEEKTKELDLKEQELDSITRHSESEISRLKNEKLEAEINYMNSELATNTMHLLNKNEFINSVKSNLESVEKKSTNNEVKSLIHKIVRDIEKNIQDEDDWDNFQIHFDKVHGDFSKRFKEQFPDLSPQDIKLSTYLRLNLSTKEIANLLNISVRGVEIARYRLRKKLNLDRAQNLSEFILNY